MTVVDEMDSDALRLQSLGYKQELIRTFTRLTNYGMTLSVVGISSGITSMFAYGLVTGGPVVMIYGWLIVGFFTLFVTLSMAEICSAYPTSGGLYFWTGVLVPERHKPIASWFTGWFNLIGQLVFITGNDLGLAMLVGSVISVGLYSQWSPQPFHIIIIYLGLIISHGICNSLGPRFLKWITHISTWWQLLAPIIVALALLTGAKGGHEPGSFVFTAFKNETGWSSMVSMILICITIT
jgi:amino acid transporter